MPRKARKTDEMSGGVQLRPLECSEAAQWGGFLSYRFDEEEKKRFTFWLADAGDEVPRMLDDVVSAGAKYSLAYDDRNEAYVASFTGRLCSASDSRFCVTARAGTLEEATAMLVYKQVIIAENDWSDYRVRSGTFMKWG